MTPPQPQAYDEILLHPPARGGCLRGPIFAPHLASAFFSFFVFRNANFHFWGGFFVLQKKTNTSKLELEGVKTSGFSTSCSYKQTLGRRRATSSKRRARRADVEQKWGRRRANVGQAGQGLGGRNVNKKQKTLGGAQLRTKIRKKGPPPRKHKNLRKCDFQNSPN